MKDLIIFDLDGTLAESKSPLDPEMGILFGRLLSAVKVAVISGGAWPQFEKQMLTKLTSEARLEALSILPTCGTRFYSYDGTWNERYAEDFTSDQKSKIIAALTSAMESSGFEAEKHWGEVIEDRGSQITLSALGQDAPLDQKKTWDPDFAKRKVIKLMLEKLIPEFSVQLGGATSIDVTKPGIDKAYGIKKLRETLGVGIKDMLFVGDAIFPGGNDYPAKTAGVSCIRVRDPDETKRVVETIIACAEAS